MRTFTRAIAGTLAAAVIALGVISAIWTFALDGSAAQDSLGATAANAVIDATGIKNRIDEMLHGAASDIAAATGLPEGQVTGAIDSLDIPSWTVVALPEDAVPTGSFDTTYQGAAATVTTYSDPSYVTVSALGQELTFAVPESAQDSIGILAYL